MRKTYTAIVFALMTVTSMPQGNAAGPAHVDISWMSIANVHYELGPLRILTDGYITRIPEREFHG
ncbi:MAG: hypothetical protein ACT4PQ_02490, partial [Betaproteobacteria bacterium]